MRLGSVAVSLGLLLPIPTIAQEAPLEVVEEVVQDVAPVVDIVITDNIDTDTQQADQTIEQDTSSPQITETTQESDATVVEDTFDPHDTSVSTSTEATTLDTPSSSGSSVEMVDVVVEPIEQAEEAPRVVTITEIMSAEEDVLVNKNVTAVENTEPEPEFSFSVSSKSIATKKNPKWREEAGESVASGVVSSVPSVEADNTEGTLDISGQCTDKYFVILLYKNPEDYDTSPSSYIYNKAFDCVAGKYTYSLDQLPESLGDGLYYLLIGGQGDTGSWYPTSALVPINIKKQNNTHE